MKKFIIDTTLKNIGIGFFEYQNTIYEKYYTIDKNYNSILIDIIDEALKKSNLELKDFDIFAATSGPGSFTGIRVGLAFIKAIANVYNKKVYSMSTLDVMKASIDSKEKIYPVLDAKRGEVYTINYSKKSSFYEILPLEEYVKIIKKNKGISVALKDDYNLVETLKKNSKIKVLLLEKIELKIINNKIENDQKGLQNIYDLMPVYIRESDAEINLKRKK